MKNVRLSLFFALLFLFSVGKWYGDALRGEAISVLSPFWEGIHALRKQPHEESSLEGKRAHVIYRTPSLWHSVLWIDLGVKDVELNSPVVVDRSLVGVIDYVGKRQSRVRLITDASNHIAVRVSRGEEQFKKVRDDVDTLLNDLSWFKSEEITKDHLAALEDIKRVYLNREEKHLLAKGELKGSSQPLWKKKGQLLTGIGFNLDFADERSLARDLRTGAPLSGTSEPKAILQKHDLLVTSGLDGLFPEGLLVAVVKEIDFLQEGDYYYSLIAEPTATNLGDLTTVTVLSPLGFDPQDLPPTFGRR